MYNGNDWIYRTDAGAQLHAGDTVSVWLQFAGAADGRAYFGFGASSSGTLSLVAAPNTGQLILQSNPGFGNFNNLAAVNTTYLANHWYRLEVDWSKTGAILGKLFDSNGTTLLTQVSASTTAITSGGIAFHRHRQRQILRHRHRELRRQHLRQAERRRRDFRQHAVKHYLATADESIRAAVFHQHFRLELFRRFRLIKLGVGLFWIDAESLLVRRVCGHGIGNVGWRAGKVRTAFLPKTFQPRMKHR